MSSIGRCATTSTRECSTPLSPDSPRYIVGFAKGRENLSDQTEMPEVQNLPEDACRRHALDISYLHLWVFSLSAHTLASSICRK